MNEIQNEEPIDQFVDNLSAVADVKRPFTNPAQILAPEADILLHCHHKKLSIAALLSLEWIKAH